MKNTSWFKQTTWRTFSVFAIFVTVFAVGCSKGGDGGSSSSGGTFRSASCTNCNFNEYFLARGLGRVEYYPTTGFQVSLDFYADKASGSATSYGATAQSTINQYSGKLGAAGDLYVDGDASQCGLPAGGRYELTTLQAGQARGGYFTGLVLEGFLKSADSMGNGNAATNSRIVVSFTANGGNMIQYRYSSPVQDYYGTPYNFMVMGAVTIVSVNGYPCGVSWIMN